MSQNLSKTLKRGVTSKTLPKKTCGREHGPPLRFELLEDRQLLSASGPHILLTPSELSSLRQMADANTPQWQAFKANLDGQLNEVFTDNYQASQLTWISDYALGYQILKDSDPATAAGYADKAIAFLKSGLRDYQAGDWYARQLLARGDGTTRTFTLPNADFISSSLQVFLHAVHTSPVVHGDANGADDAGHIFIVPLKVSKTRDGMADYARGTDWQRGEAYWPWFIDWSPGGQEPAPGATYYVTYAEQQEGVLASSYTVSGNTITFNVAPTAGQAVFAQYVYGTHAPDGSTLAYQQTGAGDGGFKSVFIDTTYSSRYLGKHTAMGLDWLDGYPGLSAALKQEAMAMLVRWNDYLRDNGYNQNSAGSNYGAGSYVSQVMTGLALKDRDPANGPRILNEALSWRQNILVPTLQDPSASLKGGFWAEGWNYGQLAAENLVLGGLALEGDGDIPSAAVERQWANEVITSLVEEQPGPDRIYNAGDWYTYPAPFPGKTLLTVLGAAASDPAMKSHANHVLQHYPGDQDNGYLGLLFRDPEAPASFWSSLPLAYYAQGQGLLTARSDWGNSPVWMAFQAGNMVAADHQTQAPGMIVLNRGVDELLVNGVAPGGGGGTFLNDQYCNELVIDDHGETSPGPEYARSTGFWYGDPGVVTRALDLQSHYAYMYADVHAAWSKDEDHAGDGGPAKELTRQVVYLRPDEVVIFDRATTTKASYNKQLSWHFLNRPTVRGNSWVAREGKSKLFGASFSTVPLTTTAGPVRVGWAQVDIQQILTENARAAPSVRYVTAMQIAPSSRASMVATQHVVSLDGRMEGVQMGSDVVLFGRNGQVDLNTTTSYEFTATGSVQHMLTNLAPAVIYRVALDGRSLLTASANAEGVLTFTTSAGGKHTVQVARLNANNPPVARPDRYTTPVRKTLAVRAASGVLANDADVEQESLRAVKRADPKHGTLKAFAADGSFTYVPKPGYHGKDSFTYLARDAHGASKPVTVTILVNTPPVAQRDVYRTSVDKTLVVKKVAGVLKNDRDADRDRLIAVRQSDPSHGKLKAFGSDGSFTYVPDRGFRGTDTFTYLARDAYGNSKPATVTIRVGAVTTSAVDAAVRSALESLDELLRSSMLDICDDRWNNGSRVLGGD